MTGGDKRATHVGNSMWAIHSKRNIFRFMDLPAELRNRIYDLSLTTSATIELVPTQDANGRNIVRRESFFYKPPCRQTYYPTLGLIPSLLLVNKAIYAEGVFILYANKLSFNNLKGLFIFIISLSAMAKSWVQDLTLKVVQYGNWLFGAKDPENPAHPEYKSCDVVLATLMTLIGVPNLKHLHLRLTVGIDDLAFWDMDSDGDFDGLWKMDDFVNLLFPLAHMWLDALSIKKGSQEKAVEVIDIEINDVYWPDSHHTPGFSRGNWTPELRKGLLRKLCIR